MTPRFERNVARVTALGPRVVAELLAELGRRTMHTTTIEQMVERYAAIDPDALRLLGGNRFAPRPTLRIVGGRRHG